MSLFSGALIALCERECVGCMANPSSHYLCNTCYPVNARIVAYDAIDAETPLPVQVPEIVSQVPQVAVQVVAQVPQCLECNRTLNPNDPPSNAQRPSICMDCRRRCRRCRNALLTSEMTNRRLGNQAGVHCRNCREELSYRFPNM